MGLAPFVYLLVRANELCFVALFDCNSLNKSCIVNIKYTNICISSGGHPWKCANLVARDPSICKLDRHVYFKCLYITWFLLRHYHCIVRRRILLQDVKCLGWSAAICCRCRGSCPSCCVAHVAHICGIFDTSVVVDCLHIDTGESLKVS